MVAVLREMQENQWVSELRIDKPEFSYYFARLFICTVDTIA